MTDLQTKSISKNTRFLKRANSIERAKYSKHYFIINRVMLLVGGVWLPQTKHLFIRILYKAWSTFTFIFVITYFPIAQLYMLTKTYHDTQELIKNVSMALTHFIGVFKVIMWHIYKNKVKSIMQIIESDDLKYECCGEFQPSIISKKARRTGYIFSLALHALCHWTLFTSYSPGIVHAFFNPIYVVNNGTEEFYQTLPYYSWFPYEYNNNRFLYILTIFAQMGQIFIYAYIIIGFDTLFMCLLNHTCAHFIILQGALKTIKARSLLRVKVEFEPGSIKDSKQLDNEMQYQMKKCINHLQILMEVCKDLENVFTIVTLAQVLTTLFTLCTCLYLVSMTSTDKSSQFLSAVAYTIAMAFQLFLYCWFGNEVFLASSELSQAIYESDWQSSSKELKVLMLITMTRMTRPIFLTAGKFAPLTLETFVSIVRGSYSLFAVLKTTSDADELE